MITNIINHNYRSLEKYAAKVKSWKSYLGKTNLVILFSRRGWINVFHFINNKNIFRKILCQNFLYSISYQLMLILINKLLSANIMYKRNYSVKTNLKWTTRAILINVAHEHFITQTSKNSKPAVIILWVRGPRADMWGRGPRAEKNKYP